MPQGWQRRQLIDDVSPLGSLPHRSLRNATRRRPSAPPRRRRAEAAAQPARPERRYSARVGDLGQRVGLVHELRQLRRAEELADSGGSRLGVDQVLSLIHI